MGRAGRIVWLKSWLVCDLLANSRQELSLLYRTVVVVFVVKGWPVLSPAGLASSNKYKLALADCLQVQPTNLMADWIRRGRSRFQLTWVWVGAEK